MSEKQRRRSLSRAKVLIAAALVFILLTTVAIAFYSGGNDTEPSAGGYSFTRNFFSDLGATRPYDNEANVAAAVMFMLALACVGVALMSFAFDHVAFEGRGRLARLGKVSVPVAIVSGLAFIGIGATPWNVSEGLHLLFVQIAFGFLLIYVAMLITLQIANGWSRAFTALNVAYVVLLAAYVVVLFFGPDPDASLSGLMIQVLAQKVIVFSSVLNLGLQALGVWLHLRELPGDSAEAAA